jgi:predicted nucleic acid-binding protein
VIHFLDTSVLVKRYVREPGSATLWAALRRGRIVVARITHAEILATLARARREGVITEPQRARAFERVEADFRELNLVEIRGPVLSRVAPLVLRHPLRGYDAVQLAAALTVKDQGGAIQFWSADQRLADAARQEGLRVGIPAG